MLMPDMMACSACERVMPVTKLRYAGYDGWLCTGDETGKCYEILEERDLRMQPIEELAKIAYEAYASDLANEGHTVPTWTVVGWKYRQAWLSATQVIVNSKLWESA